MTNPGPSSSSITSKPTYSCVRCADRKVKCDRNIPCSACSRHKVDCVYQAPQPSRNRHKRAKEQILTDRLRLYEELLREKGVDPSGLTNAPNSESSSHAVVAIPNETQSHTSSSVTSEQSRSVKKPQVIQSQGRSNVVDNKLWTRMVEEFHDPQDALGDSSSDTSDMEAAEDDFGYVLGIQTGAKVRSRHPPPEGIHQLWEIFIDNVDPLTKVIHVPTLRPAIEKAASDIDAVPRSFEALMFAIYAAAVMSLDDKECTQQLNEPRKVLLSRYVTATNAALLRAKFMGSTSLVVLQALILHLHSVREINEPRAIWSLTGVAVRIAHAMGLERDGEFLGLPPFETEMRRRIWWLLKTHDFRTAELCGIAKFRDLETGAESTKWPTNVNDDELSQGMSFLASDSNRLTDAVFISLKYDLVNFAAIHIANAARQGVASDEEDLHRSESDTAEIGKSFKYVQELLETKYLRYCDPSQPLHLMAMLMARCSMNVIRFLSYHPRRWAGVEQAPLSERQWVWEACINLLEQHSMLQSNPQLKQFAWYAPYVQQWHAIIHILDTLRASPLTKDADKAWKLVRNTYENNPEMTFDLRKPIHVAVGNLCLKAYGAREAALQKANVHSPPIPQFILQLRQQREVTKAKRQARYTRNSKAKDSIRNGQESVTSKPPGPTTGVSNLSEALDSTCLQQSTTSHSTDLAQTYGAPNTSDGDAFWFTNGFEAGHVGDVNNALNMDLDFMLDQDYGVEDNSMHNITWDQWDSWLAESNAMPPLSSKEDS